MTTETKKCCVFITLKLAFYIYRVDYHSHLKQYHYQYQEFGTIPLNCTLLCL